MPPSPPPQGTSVRLMVALAASLFATLWLAGWSHAATPAMRYEKPVSGGGGRVALPVRAGRRLLLPRQRPADLDRPGLPVQHGRGGAHARVRAPHRDEPAERPVAGGRLGHEALGDGRERVPEDAGRARV